MSNFYINSVKRKMKFQRLDLQNLQNEDIEGLNNLSPQDEIRQDENNLRDETISNLKLKLHNNFSHILGNHIGDANDVIDKITDVPKETHINDTGYLNEAQSSLDQIQKLAGLDANQSNSNDLDNKSPDKLMNFISELRILTEKRSQIKVNLKEVDESLLKLQEEIFKNKKMYEDKIAYFQSINEIYNQSSKLVSKIVSEDTKYEQL